MAEMRSGDADAGLNSSQRLHLLSSSQHADKLLSEVESILAVSQSKSPFRKYKDRLAPAQAKVVGDYIARIRNQIVRILESQGIPLPEPEFESIHSIRVTLAFIRIAFQECTPDRMRGYGALPEGKIRELNGLVDEMVAAVEKLDVYLAQGLGAGLDARLERLAKTGLEVGLLKNLERIIQVHGLVEFRPALSMILDRLESKGFEVAVFGRVSSGKSSLLNHIVQNEILPVGVTPITAVPTRLMYGAAPRLSIWYADHSPERAGIDRLPEFVSEHQNPGNRKHVTRIIAELPSDRLRDGVVLVDTPGLGSLATSGAAETLAYLPRCDLGVVLVDAGSTLTEDDLGTIRILYEAGIPACVLLSKSDLLTQEDRLRSSAYIADQMRTQLGLAIPVHPVSVQGAHAQLLEGWLGDVLLPMFDRHQQLAEESIARKIGSLREGVSAALRIRLTRRADREGAHHCAVDVERVDARLRRAVGRIAEIRQFAFETGQAVRRQGEAALAEVARRLSEAWPGASGEPASSVLNNELARIAAERAGALSGALRDLAADLSGSLEFAAQELGYQAADGEAEIESAIQEMPRFDPGTLQIELRPGLLSKISVTWSMRRNRRVLRRKIGPEVEEAFSNFGGMLDSWARRTLAELQLRFEAQADRYRAHLSRISTHGEASGGDQAAIRHDLASLGEIEAAAGVAVTSAP